MVLDAAGTGRSAGATRAVRGAVQLDVDEREHLLASTRELGLGDVPLRGDTAQRPAPMPKR